MSNILTDPEEAVTIKWLPADVKSLYPDWTDEQCAEALHQISNYLVDSSIESGWEILGVLLQNVEVKP